MPILTWGSFPETKRNHAIYRLAKRIALESITHTRPEIAQDIARMRIWAKSEPIVPNDRWWADFRSFKLECIGLQEITALSPDMVARGLQVPVVDSEEMLECYETIETWDDLAAFFQ